MPFIIKDTTAETQERYCWALISNTQFDKLLDIVLIQERNSFDLDQLLFV